MSAEQPDAIKVVIVGGQFAGRRAQADLQNSCNPHVKVTLIDSKPFFEYTPSLLRTLVEPQHVDAICLPQPGRVVAQVVGISPPTGVKQGAVHLHDGALLMFDYCIICSGSSYAAPIKVESRCAAEAVTLPQRKEQLHEAAGQLRAAKNIVVVGGGTVGVELAAEIVGTFGARKHVTLVASQPRLLESLAPGGSAYALRWLQRHGVKVLLNDRVLDLPRCASHSTHAAAPAPGTLFQLETAGGLRLEADLVYACIGGPPMTQPFVSLLACEPTHAPQAAQRKPASGLTVNKYLQVAGHHAIFACGDCIDCTWEKTALAADIGAALAAGNILRAAAGRPLLSFAEGACYGAHTPPLVQVVSLYKYHAVMQLNCLHLNGPLPAFFKVVIEFFQLQTAQDRKGLTWVWRTMEALTVWAAAYVPKLCAQ